MTYQVMRNAIYNYLKNTTQVTVIEDLQGKPRPAFPYVSFRFLRGASRVGGIDESTVDDDQHGIRGLRETTVSINVFGNECGEIMEKITNCLDLPETIDLFTAANMAHYGESGPIDLSALMETSYEKRMQMDLLFRYGFSKDSTISSIEQVEVLGQTDGQGQSLVIETEINIIGG